MYERLLHKQVDIQFIHAHHHSESNTSVSTHSALPHAMITESVDDDGDEQRERERMGKEKQSKEKAKKTTSGNNTYNCISKAGSFFSSVFVRIWMFGCRHCLLCLIPYTYSIL